MAMTIVSRHAHKDYSIIINTQDVKDSNLQALYVTVYENDMMCSSNYVGTHEAAKAVQLGHVVDGLLSLVLTSRVRYEEEDAVWKMLMPNEEALHDLYRDMQRTGLAVGGSVHLVSYVRGKGTGWFDIDGPLADLLKTFLKIIE